VKKGEGALDTSQYHQSRMLRQAGWVI